MSDLKDFWPGTLRCKTCGGQWALMKDCGTCGGLGYLYKVPTQQELPLPSAAQTDVRLAIAEAFKERADQALIAGDWYLHGIWNQAADLARDFIVRPGTRST